jgi:hypothetical protein
MKTILISILVILSSIVYSQKKVKVIQGSEKFSVGRVDVLIANIYEADKNFVEKAWKKQLKKYGGKISSKSEILSTAAVIKQLGEKQVDIYAIVKNGSDETVLIEVAIDLGGAYLSKSQHPMKYKEMESILRDFAVDVSKEAVKEKIADQEKILAKFTKEQEKLEKDNTNLKQSIEDYKQKIKDAEQEIVDNEKEQENNKKVIEDQNKVVEGLSQREKAIE